MKQETGRGPLPVWALSALALVLLALMGRTSAHAQGAALAHQPSAYAAGPTPTRQSVPPSPPNCQYGAAFVRDVTLPDDARVTSGSLLTKVWELRNTGTCHWGGEVLLTPVENGRPILRSGRSALPATLAGETVQVRHSFFAPRTDGPFEARYRLCVGDLCFGPVFWLRVRVSGGVPAATPTRAPTAAPASVAPPALSGWTGYTCDRCIKGNISYTTGERIYHLPGCEYYAQTVINTAYGERWFSSEAEAIQAGWRKAMNCP